MVLKEQEPTYIVFTIDTNFPEISFAGLGQKAPIRRSRVGIELVKPEAALCFGLRKSAYLSRLEVAVSERKNYAKRMRGKSSKGGLGQIDAKQNANSARRL